MQYLNIIVCGLIVFSGCGRFVKVSEQERMIRQVFAVQLSKDEIFDRALEWCAKKAVGRKDAVILKEREKGKIIARGSAKYSEFFDFLVDRRFGYTLTIEVKEARYRVSFDNFTVEYDERDLKSAPAEFQLEIDKIKSVLGKTAEDLRDFVSRDVKEEIKKEEEW
jgi:hypothetical protein